MIGAASGDACPTRFKKGIHDGQGQQLSGQRQEEGKGQDRGQAGAKAGWKKKVSVLAFSCGVQFHSVDHRIGDLLFGDQPAHAGS